MSISIYLSESGEFNIGLVVALGSLLLLAIIVEYNFQLTQVSLLKVLATNLLFIFLAALVLNTGNYLINWFPRLFGPQFLTLAVYLFSMGTSLFFIKKLILASFDILFNHPALIACSPLAVLIPLTLFYGYIFILGSGYQN